MSENVSPVTVESTPPNGEADTDKTKKKKKALGLGAFAVEAQPEAKRSNLWGKDKSDADKTSPLNKLIFDKTKNESDKATDQKAETSETEIPVEQLDASEESLAISQLAADRLQELQSADLPEAVSFEEQAAVEAYLAAVEASGELEMIDVDNTLEITDEAADSPEESDVSDVASPPTVSPPSAPGENSRPPVPPTPPVPPSTPPPTPPTPPAPPSGPPPQGPRDPNPNGPIGPGASPGGPGRATFNTIPSAVAAGRERQARSEGLVVGAIVGYLVGRRRGRIKTEKRLIPVQKKLEQQVLKLQSKLQTQEAQVRQQVREKIVPTIALAKQSERLVSTTEVIKPKNIERKLSHSIVPPERIGHVLVQASAGPEKSALKKPTKEAIAASRQKVEAMDREQLLAVSQQIQVEGTTLRQIYETQLVSEKGLRRLVAEHLRGGNVSRVLKRELVERQIDFERDPILRDQNHTAGSERAGKTALAAMLQRAGMPTTAEPQTVGYANKTSKSSNSAKKTRTGQQAMADISLITVIATLVLLIGAILIRG